MTQSLISLFSLSITFGMITRSEVELHVQCSSKGLEEVGYEFHATLGSDMAWDTMLGKYVENEQLHKLCRHNGVVSQDEK